VREDGQDSEIVEVDTGKVHPGVRSGPQEANKRALPNADVGISRSVRHLDISFLDHVHHIRKTSLFRWKKNEDTAECLSVWRWCAGLQESSFSGRLVNANIKSKQTPAVVFSYCSVLCDKVVST